MFRIGKTELLTSTLCSMQIECLFTVLIMECTEARKLCTSITTKIEMHYQIRQT